MKNLWKNYKQAIHDTFPELRQVEHWNHWEGKMTMDAYVYRGGHFMRTREALVRNDTTDIYNHVLYPYTGKNTPCFSVDLMGFFENKVIIVFDFQHPVENFVYSLGDRLPKDTGTYRFFEMGNHFSEHIFVRKCTMSEVDNYLDDFVSYLSVYKEVVYNDAPFGIDTSAYKDFDSYMRKLDPISGYMNNIYDKDKSKSFVEEFLFIY